MAKVIMTKRGNCGEYQEEIICKAEGKEAFAQKMCEKFLDEYGSKGDITIHGATVKIADMPEETQGVKEDVVAIYDNEGIPSFMYRFTKKKNCEVFPGGSEKIHPAFIIGGKEYDEIYISVYENCEINGKPYSLPMQKPWTNITNDKAAEACFSKGDGWHLMTRAEWGLLANLSKKNETLPHGNTSSGKYHAAPEEKGKIADGYVTLTGSGPATWTHDHTPEGVHDLCGNIWEMVRGLRIKNGYLQIAENNDAALDIDLTLEGDGWRNLTDDKGNAVRVSVDEDVTFTTSRDIEQDDGGCEWEDVSIECESEQMKELALYVGEPNAYCYIDSTDGECLPLCGGSWYNAPNAGVFYVDLGNPRSYASGYFGFRSAFYRKAE